MASCRSSSCRAVVTSRAPVLPTGWPSAMTPPLTLTRSGSGALPAGRRVLVVQPHRGGHHRYRLGRRRRGGRGCRGRRGRARPRLEAGEVTDVPHGAVCPPRPHPHTGLHRGGRARVDGVQHGGVGTVQPDQRPGEGVPAAAGLPVAAAHSTTWSRFPRDPPLPGRSAPPRSPGRTRTAARAPGRPRRLRRGCACAGQGGHELAQDRPQRPGVVEADLLVARAAAGSRTEVKHVADSTCNTCITKRRPTLVPL